MAWSSTRASSRSSLLALERERRRPLGCRAPDVGEPLDEGRYGLFDAAAPRRCPCLEPKVRGVRHEPVPLLVPLLGPAVPDYRHFPGTSCPLSSFIWLHAQRKDRREPSRRTPAARRRPARPRVFHHDAAVARLQALLLLRPPLRPAQHASRAAPREQRRRRPARKRVREIGR